ncbi:MAG: FAD-binding oxidoreductase [Rhodospirillaceae bacterium]|nr:FAD-binding oxidoreductase [Rhodospirillaceae bacterium]
MYMIDIVGKHGIITDSSEMFPYLEEERGIFHGRSIAVVCPSSVSEISSVVRLCASQNVGIVPQGGNTGLCGGAIPSSGTEIILSLSRLNKIRAIDPINFTITVDSGVVLETIQKVASDVECLFPLSFPSEGSAQIGGIISTNAGGVGVLRYGNARDLVMGLEVILPDGEIWDGLLGLRKDNTGYDLKQLFVGSEGTLGVITAAVLKLFPKPRDIQTAFCALSSLDAVISLFSQFRVFSNDQISAFELISRICLDMTIAHTQDVIDPFVEHYDWYILIELSSSRDDECLSDRFNNLLSFAIEKGYIADAVIASSYKQQRALWHIRESIPEAQKSEGGSIKHDVSVPISVVPDFIRQASLAVETAMAGIRVVAFGHVGDGNIHFNLSQPIGADRKSYLSQWDRMNRIVHDLVIKMNGSISAEHGIGQLKRKELEYYKAPLALALMKRIKASIDPNGLMNPGKIFK